MPSNPKPVWFEIAKYVLYGIIIAYSWYAADECNPPFRMVWYHWLTRASRSLAYRAGRIAIYSEHRYYEVIEEKRHG